MKQLKATFDDLRLQVEDLRGRFPQLSDDHLFVIWFLCAYLTDDERRASDAITGGSRDKDVDAVYTDDSVQTVFVVQGKYRQKVMAKSESRNDVTEFARLARSLSGEDSDFQTLCRDLDPLVEARLKEARARVKRRGYRVHLYYVTLGKCSKELRLEAETLSRPSEITIFDGKQVMSVVDDYLGQGTRPVVNGLVASGVGPAGGQRDRIRLAAVQLFTRQSYAGTSMKQLAQELGMVPANLYNYYPKKEAILFEVLSHELVSLLARDADIAAATEDPVARVRAYAHDLVLQDLRDPLAAFVGHQGVSGLSKANRDDVSRLMARVRESWMAAIREGVALGVFTTSDPKLSTLTILTLCSSTSAWYNPQGEYTKEAVAEHAADAALRILGLDL